MKSKTLTLGITLALVLAVLLSIVACAPTSTPAPTQKPTSTAAPTTTPAAKPTTAAVVVNLKWADMSAAKGARPEVMMWMADEMSKRSGGRIKTDFFWGESLLATKEMLRGVGSGAADIGMGVTVFSPAELVLWSHNEVVLRGVDPEKLADWMFKGQDEFPALREAFTKQNVKGFAGAPPTAYHLISKKLVQKLDEMKGMRIRAGGNYGQPTMESVGATNVFLTAGEFYAALDKGTVDAVETSFDVMSRYSLPEVAKHVLVTNRSVNNTFYVMNLNTWNKLPQDIQKIVADVGREGTFRFAVAAKDADVQLAKKFKDAGMTITDLPASDIARWEAMPGVQKITSDWIAAREKDGLPGKAIMDRYLKGVYQ